MEPEEEPTVDDEEDQEEEITRCICGQAEYPGPTQHARDLAKGTEGWSAPSQRNMSRELLILT